MRFARFARLIAASLVFACGSAASATTTLTFTNVGAVNYYGGLVFNASDGTYLRRTGYDSGGAFTAFGSSGDAAAGTSSTGTLSLAGSSGTYFAEQGGAIYGHYATGGDFNANSVGEWNATTGALISSATISSMSGTNGYGFDWGGYSTMNVLQDSTGMYLLSRSSSSAGYVLASLNADLTLSNPVNVSFGSPGFGFMAGGQLYYGDNYNSQALAGYVSASNGAVSPFNVTFAGLGSVSYITHAEYVEGEDALYLWDLGSNAIYRTTGVASALGLDEPVPEPRTWALMLLGFGGMGFAMRRSSAPIRQLA